MAAQRTTDAPKPRVRTATIAPIQRPRLRPDHQRDLRDVARGVEESDVGLATRYLDALESGGHSDEVTPPQQLNALEGFCESTGCWSTSRHSRRRRVVRCHAALTLMRSSELHDDVAVLHVVYGHPDPSTRHLPRVLSDSLGELVSLARYCPSTEVHRRKLARDEVIALLRRDGGPIDLREVRERERRAERIATSGDALRSMLASFDEGKPKDADLHPAHDARKRAHESRRTTAVALLRVEAQAMLERAEAAYSAAWARTS